MFKILMKGKNMKIEKKNLNEALNVLGKVVSQTSPVEVQKSIRFVGDANGITAMATDGTEVISLAIEATAEYEIDFCVPFKDLKDMIRFERSEMLDIDGTYFDYPQIKQPIEDAVSAILPVNFGDLLALAAPIIDRNNYRRILQGVNLSSSGITVTDGKQLLHQPCPLALSKDITLPFPSALLAFKPAEMGTLQVWENYFCIEIGHFQWTGKLLEGNYPNWRNVIPTDEQLNYCITLTDVETVINWLKLIPPCKEPNGIEFNVTPNGLKLISCRNSHFEFTTHAEVVGAEPRAVLTLDREIILRMLMQGYTILQANSDCALPVLASGGSGQYIAMPIRTIPKTKEEKNMETENHVVEQTAPVVNPLDELSTAIEEFKVKVKAILDESTALSRKVKEVVIAQKQKERDFIQAKRAIERIRMAI